MNDGSLARVEREGTGRPDGHRTRNEHGTVGIGVVPRRRVQC
jgi:hypothetical protein